jgi:N-ethylmaleimide reductase
MKLLSHVAEALNAYRRAWLRIIEPRIRGNTEVEEGLPPVAATQPRKHFKGKIISAGGFKAQSADQILKHGDADAVAFGRFFIANPDLRERFRLGASFESQRPRHFLRRRCTWLY